MAKWNLRFQRLDTTKQREWDFDQPVIVKRIHMWDDGILEIVYMHTGVPVMTNSITHEDCLKNGKEA